MKNWNTKDERCPHCNNIIKQSKGLNKQNLKSLCFSKPTTQDIIIFILLSLCLLMVYMYYNEISQYEEMYEDPKEFCTSYWMNTPIDGNDYKVEINISNYKHGR